MFIITGRKIEYHPRLKKEVVKYTILDTNDGVEESWFSVDIPKNIKIFGSRGYNGNELIIPRSARIIILGRKPKSMLYTVAISKNTQSVVIDDLDASSLKTLVSSGIFRFFNFKYNYYEYCRSLYSSIRKLLVDSSYLYKSDIELSYATMSKEERAKQKLLGGVENDLNTVSVFRIEHSKTKSHYTTHSNDTVHWLMMFDIVEDVEEYNNKGVLVDTFSSDSYTRSVMFGIGASEKPIKYDKNRFYNRNEIYNLVYNDFMKYSFKVFNNILIKNSLDDILECQQYHRGRFGYAFKNSFYLNNTESFIELRG